MAQWYCASFENSFPQGYPGSIPGLGVCLFDQFKSFKYIHYNYITMVMDTLQIRMNNELLKRIDLLVKAGMYSNRADVIRDAVRRFVWEKEVGTVPLIGNSVELVRKARRSLSKNIKKEHLDEINYL